LNRYCKNTAGLPRLPEPPFRRAVRIERVLVSIASPFTRPSPLWRRVGIRTSTFETCSDFTHVTARSIAQPPKATFVTRLQPSRLPSQTARQLPEQIDNSPGGSCRHWSHAPSGRTP